MDCQLVFSAVILLTGIIKHSECLMRSANVSADTLIFTTVLTVPYVMEVEEVDENGDIVYEGFIIDLWEKMNMAMKNKYEKVRFVPAQDGNYGQPDMNGTWNGMIGEVISGEADAAFAPLSITKTRSKVVDFTKYFQNVHTSLLLRKDLNIKTIDQLLNDSKVSYGCISGGRTNMLLKESKDPVVMQMNASISSDEVSLLVPSNEEGVAKAVKEDYAFIGESATLEYLASHHCGLTTFELKAFPATQYGIALEKKSRFKSDFNSALRSLRESGDIQMLYDKWWKVDVVCDETGDFQPHGDNENENGDNMTNNKDGLHSGCENKQLSIFYSMTLIFLFIFSIIFNVTLY